MRDLKLSEAKEICKANKSCNNCEFYIKDNYKCMITKRAPCLYKIDEEQPKDSTIETLRKFFNNHKEFRIVKNSKENKFGLKLTNDYAGVKDYNFSGEKKDFELECFVHNISEDLFNALKEIGIYVEEEN